MSAIRARVRGGRLLVDAPTDLPEGLEVSLAIIDDDLDDAQRSALAASLAASYEELDRGELLDARDVLAAMRAPTK